MTLTIVGLGPGSADDVTRKAWRAIERAPLVYVRTAQHPCLKDLPAVCISFDNVYDTIPDFEGVYNEIAARVIDAALVGDVVYAVPGHPLVAEATVKKVIDAATRENIPFEVIDGISFVEPALTLLGIDAI